MTNSTLNTIGLTLDILGVLLLFKFGLPSEVRKDGGNVMLFQDTDKGQVCKWHKYNFWSRVGLSAILLGFIFQIVSNYVGE
jgi:hypothetical protein